MRTRDKQIILRLTEKEYDELKANVAKTNLSMQAYLRTICVAVLPSNIFRSNPHKRKRPAKRGLDG